MGEHSGWAIGIVEPNRDFDADRNLRRAGWRVVFLTYRHLLTGHKRPGWRQATDFVSRPLFAGYIFFELHPDQPLPRPERTPGYLDVIRVGSEPYLLDHDTVWGWQMLVRSRVFDDKIPEPPRKRKREYRAANDAEARRKILSEGFAEMLPRPAALRALG